MESSNIREIIEKQYGLSVSNIEKNKNVFRIEASRNMYCLKVINYELAHFIFILEAIKHLQKNDFKYIPSIIKTVSGDEYVKVGRGYAYLTAWVNARECNYDNVLDVKNAARKLGELHKKSENFIVTESMKPRVGWFKWIETYETRKNEILNFKEIINKKDKKSEFDNIYICEMEKELQRCDRSIENLLKSKYLETMENEVLKNGFCHHDYAHHNVLITKNGINIIDFDYCILDSHLHDLSSLLLRRMKYDRWSLDNAREVIDSYMETHELEQSDIPIMAAFMEFPQDYWQRGIQYYWEKQPWGEEFFIKKLNLCLEDRDMKQEFINEFKKMKL